MFINGAVSQNASYRNSISIAYPSGLVAQKFGSIGLTVPQGTPGIVTVQLHALVTINVEGASIGSVFIRIVRGSAATDPIVYSSVHTSFADMTDQVVEQFTATGTDYNVTVPPSRFLEYSAFILAEDQGRRVGPESFNAFAFSTVRP